MLMTDDGMVAFQLCSVILDEFHRNNAKRRGVALCSQQHKDVMDLQKLFVYAPIRR